MTTHESYTSEEIEQYARDLIAEKSIKIESTRIGHRSGGADDDWNKDAGHWRIRISHPSGREISFEYSMGSGHRVWRKGVHIQGWQGQFRSRPVAGGRPDPVRRTQFVESAIERWTDFPDPDPVSVLHSLLLDGEAANYSFSEWCDDYGMNSDSIKARDMWMQCVEHGHAIRAMLGERFDEALDIIGQY